MLRVARVCQRQMSYLLPARRSRCAATTSHDHVSVCLHVSVCVFVTRRYCIKKAKRRMTRTTPRDSPGTLVFWHQVSLVDDPLPLKFALKVTHPPFEHQTFGQYPLTAPQPWELAIKVEITLIGSWPRAFQQAIDEPCTLPLSPPNGGTKRDIAIFPVNFNFCRKTSAAKFLRVKTYSGKVVATSFLYSTVHRCIAGNVHIYLTFALKVTHPVRKRRFWHISLNSTWELAKNFNYR